MKVALYLAIAVAALWLMLSSADAGEIDAAESDEPATTPDEGVPVQPEPQPPLETMPEFSCVAKFDQAMCYRLGNNRSITHIVIHCTSGHASAEQAAARFAGRDSDRATITTSAHFLVGQDGTIVQCVRVGDIAEHAHAANAYSIGIEHCARAAGTFGASDPGMPPTAVQYQASAALVRQLQARFAIDLSHVVAHHDIDPATTHTGCPELDGWDWDTFRGLLTGGVA